MTDLDLDVIRAWKLTWTPYRVDEGGTAWEWEGRSSGGTRILVDLATHAYMTQAQRDTDALTTEVERLRAALNEAETDRAELQRMVTEAPRVAEDAESKVSRLEHIVRVLAPVAWLYVKAFTDDDRLSMTEAMRLTEVQDVIRELDSQGEPDE